MSRLIPIKVSIVEDEPGFRQHLAALIGGAPGFTCTGAHGTAEAALKRIPAEGPDVVLIDLELPGMTGVQAIRRLQERDSRLEILVLTIHDDPRKVFEALEAGASGYLLKPPTDPVQILNAIREVCDGGSPMSPALARLVVQSFRHRRVAGRVLEGLTAREREILQLLKQGLTNKEIGSALKISDRTVGSHLRNIYKKLQVHGRAGAAGRA